ncbi:hypothetical protein Tco_0741138 [Tanacetum coccineum]
MSTSKFDETHNLVAFLEKPEESNGFEGIIDFLNASSIKYALTVNPTVYESCIKQFWATAKAKTVNGEHHIQALLDKKKVTITEKSVRSDLMLDDAEGTEMVCLIWIAKTTAWNEFSSTMASAIICLATNQKFNFSKYILDNMMKNLEVGVKFLMYPRGKEKVSLGRITPLFQTMMVQAPEDMGEDSAAPTDSHSTPIITQPSSSKPQKKKSRMKQRKDSGPTEPIPDEATNEEHVSTPSYDPSQSGEDRLPLTKLMTLCISLQEKVLDLEEGKTAQATEIASLKKRVKQLEKRRKSRTSGLKRLRKVGSATRVESSNNVSLGAQEDACKQGRKIADLDADEEPIVNVAKTTSSFLVSAADPVTTASATTTVNELTLAPTLIEIKAAKPKAVTIATTTITTAVASTRPKAKGIIFDDQEEQAPVFTPIVSSSQASQLPQAKDKGKAKMVKPEKPLKKKDQIALDEELALKLHAKEQAELERMQK